MLGVDMALATGAHPVSRAEILGKTLLLVLLYKSVHFRDGLISLFAAALVTLVLEAEFVHLAHTAPPVTTAQLVLRTPFTRDAASVAIPIAPPSTAVTAIVKMVEPTIAFLAISFFPCIADIGALSAFASKAPTTVVSITVATTIVTSTVPVTLEVIETTVITKLAVVALLPGIAYIRSLASSTA